MGGHTCSPTLLSPAFVARVLTGGIDKGGLFVHLVPHMLN